MAAEVRHQAAQCTLDSWQSTYRITMIRHDITAGLFAPVEILVTEKEGGAGTTVTYVRPSSLIVIEENLPLRKAAKALDEKLDALIAKASE